MNNECNIDYSKLAKPFILIAKIFQKHKKLESTINAFALSDCTSECINGFEVERLNKNSINILLPSEFGIDDAVTLTKIDKDALKTMEIEFSYTDCAEHTKEIRLLIDRDKGVINTSTKIIDYKEVYNYDN